MPLVSRHCFILAIVFFLLLCEPISAQGSSDAKNSTILDRLCGRLEHVEYLPVKNSPNSFTTKDKALRHVTLRLYELKSGEECCKTGPPVEEAITGLNGGFKFKIKQAGSYWLVAAVNGSEYKMPVQYEPRKNTDTLCMNQHFQIDNAGNFGMAITITID